MTVQAFHTLLSPIEVGNRVLKNRIVKTAAGSRYWSQDGFVTERVKALFDHISAGGAAMVSVDTMSFMPWGDAKFTMGGVWDDKFLPGLTELVDLVHANGALIIAQLHHAGPADVIDPVGPSRLTEEEMPLNDPIPRELSVEEIASMKQHYFEAVKRLVKAGFDGIEVHAAHSYFMASFLTRVWNKRHDQYGIDSFENRTRLAREIMQGVRAVAPENFLMGVRFNGIEFGNERALTIPEAQEIAKLFEAEGVDYMSITGEGFGKIPSPMLYLPADYFPYPEPDPFMKPYIKDFEGDGVLIPAASAIKEVVSVPVICVGRLDENKAEKVLSEGKADIAGFNRALWADPDMPRKLQEGRIDEIRHCNRCATCEGGGKIGTMGPRTCRVNPALGNYDMDISPAKTKKKVMVIGGGPAGMEAACSAALCGHVVSLFEQSSQLGGHLPLAAMIKGTYLDNVTYLYQYLTTMVKKLPITVHVRTHVTLETVRSFNPDAIIVATGGRYDVASIPGETRKNHTSVNILQQQAEVPLRILGGHLVNKITERVLPGVGKNVVVVGTGIAGLQGALWLKKRERAVTIVGSESQIAPEMPPRYRNRLLPWFDSHDVDIMSDVLSLKLKDKHLEVNQTSAVENSQEYIRESEAGEETKRVLDCDTAMSLPRMQADEDLCNQLKQAGYEVYAAGSVRGEENDGLIVDAIKEGRQAALLL